MKHLIILLLVFACLVNINAQNRMSLTMPFDGGTLTFQYYEKDGVKVPDGPMEFTNKNYTEKGENKDGYREGKWIARTETKTGSITAEYMYRNGLLEGTTTFQNSYKDKNIQKLYPEASYNFSKGRLIGENKIVHDSDTIYCNFGDNGKWIGIWRLVTPEKTVVFEYDDNSEIKNSYELDVLGQKKTAEFFLPSVTMALLWFNKYFQEIPMMLRFNQRPKLPTLSENKYGYFGPLDKP